MTATLLKSRWVFVAHFAAATLLACGGGVGEGGTGKRVQSVSIGAVDAVSAGSLTLTKDTRPYDVTSAKVVDGFGAPLSTGAVKRGMWVEIAGLASDADVGAETVQVQPAIRGVVTSTFPLTVLGSQVIAYSSTVRDGPTATSQLQIGQRIEVHGRLGRQGEVEASRIEKLATTDSRPFELRGLVRTVDASAKTLVLENQLVDYGDLDPTLAPQVGDSLRVASVVSPSGSSAWKINSLSLSRRSSSSSVESYYLQGFTSNFVTQTGKGPRFTIEGVTVDASTAIVAPEVVGDNVCVVVLGELEADGTVRAVAVFWNDLGTPTY
jgi:Domain of unknown function (DUF5666)